MVQHGEAAGGESAFREVVDIYYSTSVDPDGVAFAASAAKCGVEYCIAI